MWLAQQGYKTPEDIGSVSIVSNSVQVVETLTLKELTEKISTDYIKRNFMCFVTIKRVEAGDSWWYYGCNFCHEEVHLLEGRYKCVNPKCLKSSPYAEKRYRIMVLAHDKTEAVNVVLSDRAIKRLVGKTATMLLEEIEDLAETPPSTFFPQQILDIANKDVTFNILISTKRRVRGRNVETVLQISNYDENQGAKRRVRGKNVSNVLSSADSTNDKENFAPNVAYVTTNLRRLPQSILHDPATLPSDHVGKNITGKNVSKCRVRGKNVDNIMSNVSKQAYSRPPLTTIDQNSQSPSSADSTNNKENFAPNVASVTTNLRRLPQSILHDPATLPSDHVVKNITGKNVSKCRVRGKNVDNIMSNVSKQAYSRPPLTTIDQNSQSPFISQSSGDVQRNQTNKIHKNTDQSGQSTLTFSMHASTLKPINKRRPDYKKQHPPDETEQHVAKKSCGKMSPIPFSVGKDGVRSSFEVGETSGPKNLMSDFNNVEDTFSSESDSLEQGDYEDLDDEEFFYTQQDSWN
ncbi:hypothetical protein POM88_036255 [Heracleum sosnowskyi]|uniref:Replication factor A C-terminal domain-containing protein n=1 Tax=Heracleum sosnowskyi TaxID=360622 RepID=A0AAD8HNW0_9APIA|nr:hypothetical protein POM88_036255 [Heracleum sosnowskyi]